jgi:hypothetical protein
MTQPAGGFRRQYQPLLCSATYFFTVHLQEASGFGKR